MEKIFKIPTSIYETFEAKVEKINKIATKLGVTGYTVEILGTEMAEIKVSTDAIKHLEVEDKVSTVLETREDYDYEKGKHYTHEVHSEVTTVEVTKIKLSGEIPVVGGYSFVGVIEPSGISRSAPEENIPANLLKKIGSCDHCKKVRNRSMTIVVRKGKTYKVVGSGCVKDFLGTSARNLEMSAEKLSDYYEFFYLLEEMERGEGGGYSKIIPTYILKEVLYHTYASI